MLAAAGGDGPRGLVQHVCRGRDRDVERILELSELGYLYFRKPPYIYIYIYIHIYIYMYIYIYRKREMVRKDLIFGGTVLTGSKGFICIVPKSGRH